MSWDTRGKPRDPHPEVPTAEIGTDTGSVQLVELGEVGREPRGSGQKVLLVAGAILAAGFVAIVALGGPFGESTPTSSPTPTNLVALQSAVPTLRTTAEPTTKPPPTLRPSSAPGNWVWDPYEVAGFGAGTQLRGIWGFRSRFVAVVATPVETEEEGGAESELHSLLISGDGSAWTRSLLPSPGLQVAQGKVIDTELWLIGRAAGESGPVWEAWSTKDAISWSHAETFAPAFEGAQSVLGFARSSNGWVVVIEAEQLDAPPTIHFRYSVDGVAWATPDLPPEVFEQRDLVGIATNGTTTLVALKNHRREGSGSGLDVIVSENGLDWTLGPVVADGVEVNDLTYGPAGYVIVGEIATEGRLGEPIGWISGDGWSGSWDEVRMPIGTLPEGLSPVAGYRVIPTDHGYLATSQANGMAWTSADGIEWSAFNVWPSANEFMTSVAVIGDFVVVGRDRPGRLGFLRGDLSRMVAPQP